MDQCSYEIPLCYGTVYDSSAGICWYKNSSYTYDASQITNASFNTLAVPQKGTLTPLDTDCSFNNGSIQASASGENFTIHCNTDIVGNGYSPSFVPIAGVPGWHVTSLQKCMEKCSESNPYCKGVAYNPGMGNGYVNCYPKTSAAPDSLQDSNPSDAVFIRHSAIAQDPPFISNPCQNTGQSITSSKGTTYGMSCNQNRGGNDFKNVFEPDLKSCLDRCDNETSSDCIGVVFDTEMIAGWNNCYMKNATGTPDSGQDGFIFARRGGATDDDDGGSGSSSKAWIAGPVIGGVAAIALAGALWWYIQRRRKQAAERAELESKAAADPNGAQYSSYDQQQAYQWPQQNHYYAKEQPHTPAYEMDPQDVRPEMPASQVQPSELPGQTSPINTRAR